MSGATVIDWRNLPPVPEEVQPEVPTSPSQTFLKHHDVCDRAAMLYLRHRAGAGSHALNRGAIFHDVVARLTHQMVAQNESRVPPDVGKVELEHYMEEHPEMQVSAVERDALRYMVANWCEGSWFTPEQIVAVETTLHLDVGEFRIVGRVDLALDLGSMLQIEDYKTQFTLPDAEEWRAQAYAENGRPRFAGNFQTQVYALLAAFGTADDGMPIGADHDRFRLRLTFPRYLRPEGLAYREVEVTREQLTDFRFDVEQQLRRLAEVNRDQRRWQPTPGTHCRECPAEYECPLPRLLRPESQHAGLSSLDELEKAGTAWQFMSRRAQVLKGRVKKAALRLAEEDPEALRLPTGDLGVYVGRDQALVFVHAEKEQIRDKAALRAEIEHVTHYGGELDWGEHFRFSESTEFAKRRVPERPRKDG